MIHIDENEDSNMRGLELFKYLSTIVVTYLYIYICAYYIYLAPNKGHTANPATTMKKSVRAQLRGRCFSWNLVPGCPPHWWHPSRDEVLAEARMAARRLPHSAGSQNPSLRAHSAKASVDRSSDLSQDPMFFWALVPLSLPSAGGGCRVKGQGLAEGSM